MRKVVVQIRNHYEFTNNAIRKTCPDYSGFVTDSLFVTITSSRF